MPAVKKNSSAPTSKPKPRTKLQKRTVHDRLMRRIGHEREGLVPTFKISPAEPRYTIEELAQRLRTNHWTLRRWISLGRVKYIRLGRKIFIPESECNRLLSEGLSLDSDN